MIDVDRSSKARLVGTAASTIVLALAAVVLVRPILFDDDNAPVTIKSVARLGERFVAAGGTQRGNGGIWTSIDGRRWSTAPIDLGPRRMGHVLDLVSWKSSIIGVGYVKGLQADLASFWLVSASGKAGEMSANSPAASRARAIAISPSALVAVGTQRSKHFRPIVWFSADGHRWLSTQMPVPTKSASSNVVPTDVTYVQDHGFVAVGVIHRDDRVCPLAWESSDGTHWRIEEGIQPCQDGVLSEMSTVIQTGKHEIALGRVGDHAAAWTWGPTGWRVEWTDHAQMATGSVSNPESPASEIVAAASVGDGRIIAAGWQVSEGSTRWTLWVRTRAGWIQDAGRSDVGYTALNVTQQGLIFAATPGSGGNPARVTEIELNSIGTSTIQQR